MSVRCHAMLPAAVAIAVLLRATSIAACGQSEGAGGGDGRKIDVALDWKSYIPYHSPLLIAQDKGYFKKEGLNVQFHLTAGSRDGAIAVGTGKQQLGWVDLTTAAASMLTGRGRARAARLRGPGIGVQARHGPRTTAGRGEPAGRDRCRARAPGAVPDRPFGALYRPGHPRRTRRAVLGSAHHVGAGAVADLPRARARGPAPVERERVACAV